MSENVKRILLTLMMVGAQTASSAIRREDLAERCGLTDEALTSEIENLKREGYIRTESRDGAIWIYLTPQGVVAASSIYS